MQSRDEAAPKETRPTGDQAKLCALIDSAIIEAEACGEAMAVADLSAILDNLRGQSGSTATD